MKNMIACVGARLLGTQLASQRRPMLKCVLELRLAISRLSQIQVVRGEFVEDIMKKALPGCNELQYEYINR